MRYLPLLAVLVCAVLMVAPDGAEAKAVRGLKNGGDAFSWTCAGEDLHQFLDKSTRLDVVSQACAKTGKRNLSCFVVSAQFPDVPIAVDVQCHKRKGWKQATLGNSHVRLGDASTAQIVFENTFPSDVNDDDLKVRIVTQLTVSPAQPSSP